MIIGVSALICAARFFYGIAKEVYNWFFLIFYLYKEANLC